MHLESLEALLSDLGLTRGETHNDQPLDWLVQVIAECLDLVFVGIYLIDDTREWIVLRAGSGEAGRVMVRVGHKWKVADRMPIGRAVLLNELWVVDSAYLPESEEELELGSELHQKVYHQVGVRLRYARIGPIPFFAPAIVARWELIFPLRWEGNAIGAMVVNSDQADDFRADALVGLQRVADSIARTIEHSECRRVGAPFRRDYRA